MHRIKILTYYICRAFGGFLLAKWLTRRQLKILCYHGFELLDEAAFRPKLFIDGATFARRLDTIRRYGLTVISLDEGVDRLYRGNLSPNSVVITIDDGFHSVRGTAAPLLSQSRMPATVYVTTYYVDHHPSPVFRLLIQYLFWKAPAQVLTLPQEVGVGGRTFNLADPAQRDEACWVVVEHGEQKCDEPQRIALGKMLGAQLGISYEDIVARRLLSLMSAQELRELGKFGLSIGLHTHRHVFPEHNRQFAEREIQDNRAALSRLVDCEPNHFCYPSGIWARGQWAWLDDLGVMSSVTCLPGQNTPRTPRHALRRFLDSKSIHQIEFEAAICGFSDLLRGLRGSFGATDRASHSND